MAGPRPSDLLPTAVLIAVFAGLFALYGPLNEGPARWSPKLPIDEHIPLIEEMVVPYVSALALGPLTLLFLMWKSVRLAQTALAAGIILLVIAYLFYVFAQTHVTRPEVTGNGVFSALLRTVYDGDNAYNCFPSLHTGFSLIIAWHSLRYDRRAGMFVAAWCALIMASTLFVHQHHLADLLAGLAVASFACWAGARAVACLAPRPPLAREPAPVQESSPASDS